MVRLTIMKGLQIEPKQLLFIVTAIVFVTSNQRCEAYYFNGQSNNNNNYYQQAAIGIDPSNIVNQDNTFAYNLLSPVEQLGQVVNYGAANSNLEPQIDLIDTQKLVAYLKQLQELEAKDEMETNTNLPRFNDLNSHLPSTIDLNDGQISGPINDPADFEAVLSHLTSVINHELPNSSNRSAILDSLLSVYLGTIMQQLKQQQQQESRDENILINLATNDDVDNEGSTTTEAELMSRSTSASASRYGNGEYIDHPLALVGHQYVQGGAGEGRQLLGPDGSFENVQVIKSDHAVPTYCDPPNPCPIGYTAEDGCLENFVNSASFSREYQVKQQCSCDNEHSLFNCASPISTTNKNQLYSIPASHIDSTGSQLQQAGNNVGGDGELSDHLSEQEAEKQIAANRLDTLARTIQNRFGGLETVRDLIKSHEQEMLQQQQNHNNIDDHYSNIVKKGSQIGPNLKY